MNLIISGKSEEISLSKRTILELLQVKKVEMPEMVSVELNGVILRQPEYAATLLKDGDQIEFLYYMGGGCGKK
ncbi:MAG: sulfur carrier protein ThiS [Bacillota bacterium]